MQQCQDTHDTLHATAFNARSNMRRHACKLLHTVVADCHRRHPLCVLATACPLVTHIQMTCCSLLQACSALKPSLYERTTVRAIAANVKTQTGTATRSSRYKSISALNPDIETARPHTGQLWPDSSCQSSGLAISCCRFTPAIASINSDLQQLAASRQDIHFVSCGQDFSYEGETGRIHAALIPDGLNLNTAGMEQLASCLDPIIHVSHLLLYAVEKLWYGSPCNAWLLNDLTP